ncbi:MAG: undecaprenyl-phosphate glucose phosphotransferase [Deltaproteobacteria bacterium]|nr:undecaprenyl-phosphate glucose phosphotransferase [Deltaproteobacteria bacterium]
MVPQGGKGAAAKLERLTDVREPAPASSPKPAPNLRALPRGITGLIRPHHSKLSLLNRTADALCVWAGLWVALAVCRQHWSDLYLVAGAIGGILFVFFAEYRDVYRGWRGAALHEELGRLITAWMGAAILLVVLGFAFKRTQDCSRLVIGTWLVATTALVSLWRVSVRLGLRELRRRGRNIRTVAIAGAGDLGVGVTRRMLDNAWMGYKPIGFFDDRRPKGYRPIDGEPVEVVGNLDEMVRRARAGEIDMVCLAGQPLAERRARAVIEALADTTASVCIVPDIFCFDLLQARLVSIGGTPTISVFENPFDGVEGWVKRLEDVVLAVMILAVTAVPMALIALCVKLSSRGPIIFKQRRYGLDGKEIVVWKFRTMRVCEDGHSAANQARKDDPRVTPLGRFLRRTSLDELPQFFNVLTGTMSVVGPRPHPVALNESYRGLIHGYMLRHKVKPGITGWAQINGYRGETECLEKMEKRINCDLWYIRNWSLWLDLRIVAASVVKGFVGKNAY